MSVVIEEVYVLNKYVLLSNAFWRKDEIFYL